MLRLIGGAHVAIRTHSRTFDLMPDHVIGVIKHALGLSNFAPVDVFRNALRMDIRAIMGA